MKKQSVPVVVNNREMETVLQALCGSDKELYTAMSNFLLLDPRNQVQQLGTIPRLEEEGRKALADGDKLHARVSFEIAARLGLYYQDEARLQDLLGLAEQASVEEARHRMHQTLLSNPEKALDIAKQYYEHKYPAARSEVRKELEIAPVPLSR